MQAGVNKWVGKAAMPFMSIRDEGRPPYPPHPSRPLLRGQPIRAWIERAHDYETDRLRRQGLMLLRACETSPSLRLYRFILWIRFIHMLLLRRAVWVICRIKQRLWATEPDRKLDLLSVRRTVSIAIATIRALAQDKR